LNAITGTHVTYVIEICWGRNHLGPSVSSAVKTGTLLMPTIKPNLHSPVESGSDLERLSLCYQ